MLRSRKPALSLTLLVTAALLGGSMVRAATFEDLKNHVGAWLQKVQEIYRFDDQALTLLWQAYCEDLETEVNGRSSAEAAARVGQDLQRQQAGNLSDDFKELADLRAFAEEARKDPTPATTEDVDELLADMKKEEDKLKALQQGAVLRGSDHPYVQLAIKYGVDMHKSLCDSYRGTASVCDQEFPTLSDRRPDLVAVNGDGLWVYEFKPEGRAEQAGWKQLADYVPAVLAYYQTFFPKGQHGGFEGKLDDKFGGQAMLDAIDAQDDAWQSGGSQLKVQSKVVTYHRCEKSIFAP